MSLVVIIIAVGIVALTMPIRVSIAIGQPTIAEAGLETTTPLPPTATPRPTEPATATPPPATSVPTMTPRPTEPPADRQRPTQTPMVPTATPNTPLPTPGVPQVQIVKTADRTTVQPGERFSYTLTISNRGTARATDVVVSDEVPEPLRVIDLFSSAGDIVVAGQVVTAYPRILDPGAVVTVRIQVEVPLDAPAGPIANTAIVTTPPPDDPGDNITTTTITITPSYQASRLPRTSAPADPGEQPAWLAIWPLIVLGFGLIGMAIATRYGVFRQRTLVVTVGGAPPSIPTTETDQATKATVRVPIAEVVAMWQSGTPTSAVVAYVAARNPQVDRLAVSIAVQKVLQAAAHRPLE
jgi:uncharacterized repeat protein (TIGR01451 family)